MGNLQATPSEYVHDQWLLDHECDNCAGCFDKFTVTKRRHHCRSCGEIFCSKCCNPKHITLPKKYNYEGPQRVCEVCHSFFSGKLKKLQAPRYVAIIRYLKTDNYEPGPPMLQENINRGLSTNQLLPSAESQDGALSIPLDGSSGVSGGAKQRSRTGTIIKKQPVVKRYLDVCSIKLANWRPLGKTTRIHFCKTSRLVNEVAQSSRVFKRPAEWDMPTPLPSSDRSRATNKSGSGADAQADTDSSVLASHIQANEEYKNAAWTLECGAILHLVLDHSVSHGVDYIYLETADEVFYVQSLQPKGAMDSNRITGMGGSERPGMNPSSEGFLNGMDDPELVDADHYEHNGAGTISLYEELKELHRLMQVRVWKREKLIESGRMTSNRSDAEVIATGSGESAFLHSPSNSRKNLDSIVAPPAPSAPVPTAGGNSRDYAALPLFGSVPRGSPPLIGSVSPRKKISTLSSFSSGDGSREEPTSARSRHSGLSAGGGSGSERNRRPKVGQLPLANLKLAQVRAHSAQGVGPGGEGDIGEPY